MSEASAARFAEFWGVYPRRVAKADAERAFARLPEADQIAAVAAANSYARSSGVVKKLANGESEFLPHPSTWLNGRRFEDETSSRPVRPNRDDVSEANLDAAVKIFRMNGHWDGRLGPRPDEHNCKIPASILAKHGYGLEHVNGRAVH